MELADELRDCPVRSAAAAVIGPDGVIDAAFTHEPETRYRWASVTKIATALTVLDACLDSRLDGGVALDDPAGPPGSTLGHLLCHASGYTFDSATTTAKPGRHRIYSNHGIDVAAAHLEAVTGRPFAVELETRFLGPLGMHEVRLEGAPSRGLVGPLSDLILMAHELLRPAHLEPEAVRLASTPVLPEINGVLPVYGRYRPHPWGYGCEVKGQKNPHWTSPDNSPQTFGHFGMSGSFCWVDPQAHLACVFLCDRDFDQWAVDWWPPFSTRVLATYASPQRR